MVGAGSGIGRAVVELFADRGLRTVAADLDPASVKDLASAHQNVLTLGNEGWDATDPAACTRLMDEAVVALGVVEPSRLDRRLDGDHARSSTSLPTTGVGSSTST